MSQRFFRIRNWERFQHYKDRNPPWVKLYTQWTDDYEWSQWDDASKLLAVCTVMLAGKLQNRIPLDPKWIQQRCSLTKVPDLSALTQSGFIEEIQGIQNTEPIASDVLAVCKQDDSNMLSLARSREERREEQEKSRDARGRARTTRVPEDFSPDTDFALREIPDLDADREVRKFRDHEFRKPRSDWPAAWRNWIETCRESGRYAKVPLKNGALNVQENTGWM